MSEKVRALLSDFSSLPLREYLAFMEQLKPYLRQEEEDRQYILAKIASRPYNIPLLQWTPEEFDLLEPERYEVIYDVAKRLNMSLAFSIARALGYYGMCCHFSTGTVAVEILEVLNANLNGERIASCYIPEADIDDMIYHGLVPYPKVVLDDPVTVEILELHKRGFSEREIEYWSRVEEPLSYLAQVSLWSLVTLDYVKDETRLGNSYCASLVFPHLL